MTDKRKSVLGDLVITLTIVGVMLVIEKPAIRQAVSMRLAHYGRQFCQAQADFWQDAALMCANAYQRARL